MPNELRLDPAGIAVLLHKILEAWYIKQGIAQPQGPDVPFIKQVLDGQEVIASSKRSVPKAIRALDLGRLFTDSTYNWHLQANDVGSLSIWDRHPRQPGAVLIGYFDMEQGTVHMLTGDA